MSGEWLTLPQAAARLGRSPQTIRRWIRSGSLAAELRPGTYGLQYFVDEAVVDARRPSEARRREDELRQELVSMSQRLTDISEQLEVLRRSNVELSQFAQTIIDALSNLEQRGSDRSRFRAVRKRVEAQRAGSQPDSPEAPASDAVESARPAGA